MKLATIILAAGKGKRMGESDIPKVMHTLANKPMIDYVVQTALDAGSEKIVIIVGHKRELLIEHISKSFASNMEQIDFAIQEEQLGTGHAVMQAETFFKDFHGNIVILSGDTPLIKAETIATLRNNHISHNWNASLISGIFENPFGYGRILRDENNHFTSIREEKDANDAERMVHEVNSGIYLVNSDSLFKALHLIKTDNAQGEYYLTDIFEYFATHSLPIGATPAKDIIEISGVNTKEQLADLETKMFTIG